MNLRTVYARTTVALSSASSSLFASVPVPIAGNAITLRDIVLLVQRVMNVGIVIATLAIVAMIVYAGFKMATSRGVESEYEKGKQMLKYAIYGALVVFGVGLIVNTIANVAYDPTRVLY